MQCHGMMECDNARAAAWRHSTTDSFYWNACGRMCAWFHEHTYNSVSVCDYYTPSYSLNGMVMNVNALNISSGHGT